MIYRWYLLGGRGGETRHQGLTDIYTYILFKLAQYRLTFCSGTDSDCGRRRESLTRIAGHGKAEYSVTEIATEDLHGHSLKYFRKSHGVISCSLILKDCIFKF